MSHSLTDHLVGPVGFAFRSRGGSRLVQLLSGDTALRLVTDTELPVIARHDGRGVNR